MLPGGPVQHIGLSYRSASWESISGLLRGSTNTGSVVEEIYNNVGQRFNLSQSFNYTPSFTKNGSKQRSIVSVYGPCIVTVCEIRMPQRKLIDYALSDTI
jgi:hypothetical protein